ncbi:unnamed protein product [Cunninghamella blakesleeana]
MSTPTNDTETELQKFDSFVNEAPGNDYLIDQKAQELCRQLPNGEQNCIKLNLNILKCFHKCKSLVSFVLFQWILLKLIWNVVTYNHPRAL